MFESSTVAVVIPCYNEQMLIPQVLSSMPAFVDVLIVVDDASRDCTCDAVEKAIQSPGGERIVLIRRPGNGGVGAAIVDGYKEAIKRNIDVTAVMAGDAQMDPDELQILVGKVARDQCDYAKGNRLFYRNAWETIPRHRYLGNAFLSMLTKIASGYWHVADSQTGFTAISLKALRMIDLDNVYPRYGYPNDMLVRLNVYNFRVTDVPIRPVYNVGEQSKMKMWKVIPTMSSLILRRFLWRMKEKYIIHDFHPLVLFYAFGFLSLTVGLGFGLYLLLYRILAGPVAATSGILSLFMFMTGLQLLLFGMWFDMENNKSLK